MKYSKAVLTIFALVIAGCGKDPKPDAGELSAKLAQLATEIERLKTQPRQKSPRESELEAEVESLKAQKIQKPAALQGTYQLPGEETVTFMEANTFQIAAPGDSRVFSGTYVIQGSTVIGDLGWGKRVYQIVDENTLTTNSTGPTVRLKK